MKNGYDQFFKNAQQAAKVAPSVKFQKKPNAPRLNLDLASEDVEQQLRRRMSMKPQSKKMKKRSKTPWQMILFSGLGLAVAVWGFNNHEQVERIARNIEVDWLGSAMAESAPAKSATPAPATKAKEGAAEAAPAAETAAVAEPIDIDHLTKLNQRKKELDAREEELNRMEAELQTQKTELEKRMTELEGMRRGISSVLEEKVKVDSTKIDTLVQMYSNMKAPQAAKVFETMDEDLAVEILGRMKKKNAADIMNLLKPDKAQVFTEKFAGYKRR
jgi:flagellar motility protein MotE (MotC chaperone)